MLSGVTGVAARHGARFRKARRAAASSLSFLPFRRLRLSFSRASSLSRATSTEHRELVAGGWWRYSSFLLRLCATTTARPPRLSLSLSPSFLPFPLSSLHSSHLLALVRFSSFFFSSLFSLLLFSLFFPSFFLSFKMNACARAQVQRGQLDGLQR